MSQDHGTAAVEIGALVTMSRQGDCQSSAISEQDELRDSQQGKIFLLETDKNLLDLSF
jgi:hypothetical protein